MSVSRYEGVSRAQRAALGLVALCLFAASIAVTGLYLRGGFEGGVPVSAVFSAPGVGQQLPVGGDVKVRGVLVGRISDIHLRDDGKAVVELSLDRDVELSDASAAEIRSKTAFGQKWVELIPPSHPRHDDILGPGSVIPDTMTTEPLELERAMQLGHELLTAIPLDDLSVLLRSLADGFSGQDDDARLALDRGLVALQGINAKRPEFELALRQLRTTAQYLDRNDEDLLSFLKSLDRANRSLLASAPEFQKSLESVPTFLNEYSDFQEQIDGDLSHLIQNGATLAEILERRSDDIVALVENLEAFTTVWNSGLRQPCNGLYEFEMTCWQVYQMPGLDSRGLYGPGEAPAADEPGDPLYGQLEGYVPLDDETTESMVEAYAGRDLSAGLRSLLYAPAREAFPGLLGESQ